MSAIGAVTEHPSLRRYRVFSAVEQAPDPRNRIELTPTLDRARGPSHPAAWDGPRARPRNGRIAKGW